MSARSVSSFTTLPCADTLTGRSPRSGRAPDGVAGPLPLRLLNDAPCGTEPRALETPEIMEPQAARSAC